MEHFDFVIIIKMDDFVAKRVNHNKCYGIQGIEINHNNFCELNNNNQEIHSETKSRVVCLKNVSTGQKIRITAGNQDKPIAEVFFIVPDPKIKEYDIVDLIGKENK